MILNYTLDRSIGDRSDLVSWFYPNLVCKQNIIVSNKKGKLAGAIKGNKSILKLMNVLDLVEI